MARDDIETNRARLLSLEVVELDITLAAHGVGNRCTGRAVKRRNGVVVPRQNFNLAIIRRDIASRVIGSTCIRDFCEKSEVQATVLAFLFFDTAEIYVFAEREKEEKRTGIVVWRGRRDVEVEECGVDW